MLDKKYKFLENEKKWRDYWEKEEIYKFDKNSSKQLFSIDTPPPTISGKLHVGHFFSYTQAEIIARYNRLLGKNIFYPMGFDNNGLPTERLIEKEKGIKAKDMPRADFIKICYETSKKYEEEYRDLFKAIGISVDWDLTYTSISPLARKISQRSFIELAKKEEAYYTEIPSMWCTECETSVAQADLDSENKKSTFNFINFDTEIGEKIIIATTRPEFLPACVAIFIHPKDQKNAHLIGKNAIVPLFNNKVPIIADEKVDPEKGSGIVMCCTFGDQTDIEWWKKYKLPLREIIGNDGIIDGNIDIIGNLRLKPARKKIMEELSAQNYIVETKEIEHEVAVHERCGLEIEFKTKKQWLIHTLKHKKEFLEYADKINWRPSYMKSRYRDWVENLMWDWGISRQRYYGVAFPVWYCDDCGEIIYAKTEDLPVDPQIDRPEGNCPKCGSSNITGESDVMDTWATSSTTQLLNMKWQEEDSLVEKLSPMSLRPNAHDIIRTWDFYSIVKNFYHLKEIPWENLMISGFITDEKGKKISKSKGNNKHDPMSLINSYSADVMRYFAANGKLGTDLRFSEEYLKIGKKITNKLFNASKFVLMHLEDYDEKNDFENFFAIDKWILTEYAEMHENYKKHLDNYEVGLALGVLERFFWNFCDNYIEIVKHRLYRPEEFSEDGRLSGQKTVYLILLELLKNFSVIFPFMTEEIYQSYFANKEKKKSIHISEYKTLNYSFETIGDEVVSLIAKVRKEKTLASVSLKTEIKNIDLVMNEKLNELITDYLEDLKATLNLKKINIIISDKEAISIENLEFSEPE